MEERSKITLLFALASVLAMIHVLRGCGGYGEVGSTAYLHAKALYSICNRQDGERLEQYSASLNSAFEAGEISERELGWLEDIMAQAKAGDWQEATINARQLIKDQVKGGP